MVKGFHIQFQTVCSTFCTTEVIIIVNDIQTGINHNSTQQHKRSEAPLIKVKIEEVEGQENTNKRNRNHKDNCQWHAIKTPIEWNK